MDVYAKSLSLALFLFLALSFLSQFEEPISDDNALVIIASLRVLVESPDQETRSWEKLWFLIGDSRLFIVTWSLSYATLVVGNPSGSTNGQRTPVSRLYGNRFFECAHVCTAAIFPKNFYREPVRPVNRTLARSHPGGHFLATPVWVILKPPLFPS